MRLQNPCARPAAAVASPNSAIPIGRTFCGPKRSTTKPAATWEKPDTVKNTAMTTPSSV